MAEKQLVVAVESTGAMGAYWSTFLPDYVEKIVRTFAGNESSSQKSGGAHFAMVHFNSRSNNNCFMWQRTGWTNNPDTFISWLAGIGFSGGGFNDACIAEGLSETILILDDPMVPVKQGSEIKKHCLLVCASNPFVLPTPVYRPKVLPNDDRTDPSPYNNIGLSDAETVARCFPLRNVSLSVISPKQLPPLRTIFNAGKQNPRGGDSSIDQVKHPQYLILLSENFLEARAALNQPINGNTSSNPIILRSDATATPAVPVPVPVPGSGPQNSIPSANASMMTRPGNIPTATSIKIEPITNATYSLQNPIASPPQISQDNNNTPNITNNSNIAPMDVMQDLKPQQLGASSAPNQQLVRPVGPGAANVSILNNLSQLRQGGAASIGLPTIGGPSPIAVHMSNMISGSSTQSNAGLGAFTNPSSSNSLQGMGHAMGNVGPQAVQGGSAGMVINQNVTGTGMNVSGPSSMMSQQGAGMNPMNMQQHIHQHPNSQQSQNKYVKIWEGTLSGQRQGLPVFICKLEGYRSASASDTLAADWPSTMQIVRLIAQEHMNNKQYVGKADFLVFRTLNQHGFLGQLQEKKLCAVIQLPSQTLLLSVSDKAGRLIGMLFPGDMVVFKPQVSSSQPQPQQQLPPQIQMPQQQQQIQMPQPQQMQQMQSQSQQPGMIGGSGGMGQSSSFMRPQMNMPQSNKPNSMSGGGGFMQ